jgi:beta-glucanase (GH16 family)
MPEKNSFLFVASIHLICFTGYHCLVQPRHNNIGKPETKNIFSKQKADTIPKQPDTNNYTLVMKDDFDGNTLDTKKWQYYEENTVRGFGKILRSNIEISKGTLKLFAKRITDTNGNDTFSSGMISTQLSLNQKYGYFEIRAKVNQQTGPHCAFWLLQHSVGVVNIIPNPSVFGTEIDVFEYHRAAGTENLYFTLHWNGYDFSNDSHQKVSGTALIPGIADGFHLFALEWTPKEYIVYVDGIEKARTTTAISHVPEFLILSTEITGFGGDRYKMSNTEPDVFEVDNIKVYSRNPSVTIYGESDYYGWVSEPLLPGWYTTNELLKYGITDNDASSIEIPKGWKVIAYNEDNFKGDSVIVTNDSKSAGSFNNKLSSVKITDN